MERNLFYENYLNNLQKEVFLIAYDERVDIIKFITSFMKSKIRKDMDRPYSYWHTQHALRIFQEVMDEIPAPKVKEQECNRDAVEYLGWFYSKWHFITGESSKIILRFLPAKEGLKHYFVFHQLDESECIELAKRYYNQSRNNHRRYEATHCYEHPLCLRDSIFDAFLSVRLLYKLRKEPIYKALDYVRDERAFDFLDEDYQISIIHDVILLRRKEDIVRSFLSKEKELLQERRRAERNIYFCFIALEEEQEKKEAFVKKCIDAFRRDYPKPKRYFEYLYFYIDHTLMEINQVNECYTYYLPLSEKDYKGIDLALDKFKAIYE